ncbi:MAG: hypothetical protein ABIY37_08300 [Devosia sp.]
MSLNDKLNPEATASAHRAWSEAIDEALLAVEAISRRPPHNLADLVIQVDAIWWWVQEDDSILDRPTRTWLLRFRRSLRRLAGAG